MSCLFFSSHMIKFMFSFKLWIKWAIWRNHRRLEIFFQVILIIRRFMSAIIIWSIVWIVLRSDLAEVAEIKFGLFFNEVCTLLNLVKIMRHDVLSILWLQMINSNDLVNFKFFFYTLIKGKLIMLLDSFCSFILGKLVFFLSFVCTNFSLDLHALDFSAS